MHRIGVPSCSWYGDEELELDFPEEWDVKVMHFAPHPVLSRDEIAKRFEEPIGTPRIRDLARGKSSAVFLVDDISRPTPAREILPALLEELKEGGIGQADTLIVLAVGCHRPMTRSENVMKLGAEIVDAIETLPSCPDGDLVFVGNSSRGTPVYVNKFVMECELKIGVGGIFPHPATAFGGGAKIVLPGVTGLVTTEHNHKLQGGGFGERLENEVRLDAEEVASMVGLDAIVNAVLNGRREIIGLFVGDVIKAHRAGVDFARKASNVPFLEDADVVVADAYPLDVSLDQSGKGTWPLARARPEAAKILISGSPDGSGFHRLYMKGRSRVTAQKGAEEARFLLYSPVLMPKEVYRVFPDCAFYRSWAELIGDVAGKEGPGRRRVAVYPYASIQVPGPSVKGWETC